ncbi:MAG: sensor histidine kinase [Cytophagales bacterium]|nr:sensor histidine kinase [Cytophagales bacterium]
MKALENLNLRVIVFHVIVIGIFIIVPMALFLRSGYDPRLQWITITLSALVPFYILNISVLIPKLLNKGRYLLYFGVLAGSFVLAYVMLSLLFQEYGATPPGNKNQVEDGQWPPFVIVFPLIIYYALGISFESIVESLKQRRLKEETHKERVKAELSFLKSQINPHFLFNSLNSIYSLSSSKSELTGEAVLLLSDMMRYMLYESNGKKVPLDREIGYIQNYIALQKFRLSKKGNISIRFNCDGVPDGHDVEPLLFIPFVENAFKHGISYNETSIIDIKLKIVGDELVFEALNSCPKKVDRRLGNKKCDSLGIGLNNVARRLELLYPEKYRLKYNNGEDLFTAKLELNLA